MRHIGGSQGCRQHRLKGPATGEVAVAAGGNRVAQQPGGNRLLVAAAPRPFLEGKRGGAGGGERLHSHMHAVAAPLGPVGGEAGRDRRSHSPLGSDATVDGPLPGGHRQPPGGFRRAVLLLGAAEQLIDRTARVGHEPFHEHIARSRRGGHVADRLGTAPGCSHHQLNAFGGQWLKHASRIQKLVGIVHRCGFTFLPHSTPLRASPARTSPPCRSVSSRWEAGAESQARRMRRADAAACDDSEAWRGRGCWRGPT